MNSSSLYNIWQAPLFPVAVAATAGIVFDRLVRLPWALCLLLAAVGLTGWIIAQGAGKSQLALVFVAFTIFALGAARHHGFRQGRPTNDIERLAPTEAKLTRLRGVLLAKPILVQPAKRKELHSSQPGPYSRAMLQVSAIQNEGQWQRVRGKVLLRVPQSLRHLQAGDEIEVLGQLSRPSPPGNPGEYDGAAALRDQQVGAVLNVRHTPDAVVLLHRSWSWSIEGSLDPPRDWARMVIRELIPPNRQNLARALLLGEQTALEQADWDRFQRTGVVHVLAISGQHLFVLAWFLGWLSHFFHFTRRRSAVVICFLLLTYALFTGGRPPVMRAVVMVCSFYAGVLFRRVVFPPNSFALAWLLVCFWDPTTIFSTGCQLSFLAVAALYWGVGFLRQEEVDPLQQAIDEQRPLWQKVFFGSLKKIGLVYAATVMVWLAVSPLVAARFHLVCPVGLLIGPPVLLLTSLALLSGFLMLFFSFFLWPLAWLFAVFTNFCLYVCDLLVHLAERTPGSYWFVPDVPAWWLWSFYLMLLCGLMIPFLRRRWLMMGIALAAWLCFGLTLGLFSSQGEGMRCTFLAVGHGSCIVVETADNRTLLYDAGAITGPEVTRRHIAPFLWNRGIRRIDEIFLSHADLDHFNGLPDLLERFAVGQVSCTPTFQQRDLPGVQFTLKSLQEHRIPVRILRAGDILTAGDVQMQVLHPPWTGPEGKENVRSLVLLIHHGDHTFLLTGDLEKNGLEKVLAMPPVNVDVLMAPHHGSRFANNDALANWAQPKCVISCEGKPRSAGGRPNPYARLGAIYLSTWEHGAVTLHSKEDGLWLETFRTRQRWKVR